MTADQWTATREDGSTFDLGFDTSYFVATFKPYGTPDINSSDQATANGERGGSDSDAGRAGYLTVRPASGRTDSDIAADFEALSAFFRTSPEEVELAWSVDGVERMQWIRCRGLDDQTSDVLHYIRGGVQVRYRALNPRTYDALETDYLETASADMVNGGGRNTVAWRMSVTGPFTDGQLVYDVLGDAENTLLLPDVASGHRLDIDARRGEVRDVLISDDTWVAVTGRVLDGSSGFPGRFMSVPPGVSTFSFTSGSGTAVADFHIRGCRA